MAQISMVSIASQGAEKGKGTHRATSIIVMHPKWLHPNKVSWALDVTTQPPNPLKIIDEYTKNILLSRGKKKR